MLGIISLCCCCFNNGSVVYTGRRRPSVVLLLSPGFPHQKEVTTWFSSHRRGFSFERFSPLETRWFIWESRYKKFDTRGFCSTVPGIMNVSGSQIVGTAMGGGGGDIVGRKPIVEKKYLRKLRKSDSRGIAGKCFTVF